MMISINERAKPELKKFETFINITAHELKTPVSVLKAYIQMITRQLQQVEQHSCIKTVEKMDAQLDKLLHLISDLQDGITGNPLELHCLMNELAINDFLQLCAQDAVTAHPGLQLELTLDSNHSIIRADRERIEQVIHNLINNAVKYSGDQKYIKLSSKVQEKMMVVSVKDNGFGIPNTELAYVFDQFYRVQNSPGKQPSGLGLGLFISAEIIHKHGGQIWVESEVGLGSEFFFSLPINSA